MYGEQEGRNQNHEIEERWAKICNHLKVIEERNEEAILIGDMNKLVGNGPFGVENNNPKVTFVGKLVFTDHFSLLFKCKNLPLKVKSSKTTSSTTI